VIQRSAAGFSLIELLIATALTITVSAGVVALVTPSRRAFDTQFEAVDMAQRLRVAVDSLNRSLSRTGAGPVSGSDRGPLVYSLAPILPLRQRTSSGDPPGTFRDDAITLLWVPAAAPEATLTTKVGPGNVMLTISPASGCPPFKVLCGWTIGTTLAILGSFGHFDLFTLTAVTGTSGQLRAEVPGGVLLNSYPVGSTVLPIEVHSFFLKLDSVNHVSQLATQDGPAGADVPVVDHVAELRFDYVGDPRPAVLLKPLDNPTPPWTRYGPKPPLAGESTVGYAAGESCLFTANPNSGTQSPRLVDLGGDRLVRLGKRELGDGVPWCPDTASPNRFDADLLRIRAVTVTLRVEAALTALRGPAGALFAHAGTATNASRWLADRELQFTVAPRNINVVP
jgi:hypothetical protein